MVREHGHSDLAPVEPIDHSRYRNMSPRVYLDHAAATPLDPEVSACMRECDAGSYAHPFSLHREGCAARAVLDGATAEMATALNVRPHEVLWTSGGTESNMLALTGVLEAWRSEHTEVRPHVVTTAIEHRSVLDVLKALERSGVEVTLVPLEPNGLLRPERVAEVVRSSTALVTVHYAHNEIGAVQPIRAIAQAVRQAAAACGASPAVHTDASQAFAWLPCQPHTLGVDLMTIDSHKMYGPKGVGCLYRANGIVLRTPYGEHVRPGTPPVVLIAGCARAATCAARRRKDDMHQVATLRDLCIQTVRTNIPQAVLNGPSGTKRLANNVHFSFPGLSGEQLVLALDAAGVAASSRSACVREGEESPVMRALGVGSELAQGTLRLTLSRNTTREEVERATTVLCETVSRLYGNGTLDQQQRHSLD